MGTRFFVRICSKERPAPVAKWHIILVPETPLVAPQPRFRLLGDPRKKSKRTTQSHDYGYLQPFGGSARTGRSSEKD